MSKKLSTTQWLSYVIKNHGSFYDYSETEYTAAHIPVTIICPIHGQFSQRANDHRHGKGCQLCANNTRAIKTGDSKRKTIPERINDFRRVHKFKYAYTNFTIYQNIDTEIIVSCPKHGNFKTTSKLHIMGSGCPRCSAINMKVSKPETEWLNLCEVEIRQHTVKINGKRFIFDGFNPETNTAYLFHGDFWHGNPQSYDSEKPHPMINKTFGELYERTQQREKI